MKKTMMTRALALLLILTVLVVPAMAAPAGTAVSEAAKGVVRVFAVFDNEYVNSMNLGSGFGVGVPGKETMYFVTNRHVVDVDGVHADQVYLLMEDEALTHMGFDTSRAVYCELIYVSPTMDIAVLKTNEPVQGRVALQMEHAKETMNQGDTVYALGFPSTADYIDEIYIPETDQYHYDTPATVDQVTFTNGVLSKFGTNVKENNTGVIQHTAGINGGNSGGPLINSDGHVIGVNTFAVSTDDNTDTPHSYSVEISQVIPVLKTLNIDVEPEPTFNWLILVGALVVLGGIAAVVILVVRKNKKPTAPVGAAAPVAVNDAFQAATGGSAAVHVMNNAPSGATGGAAPKQQVVANDSGYRFQALSGVFEGQRFAIGQQVTMGRNPSNDFVYPEDTQGISGFHCSLIFSEGKLFLKDEGATYGTFLGNGQQLAHKQAVELHTGDRFYLASTKETFVITRKGGAM